VVTLLEAPENEVCWGVAYQVPADEIGWIHAQLELREIAGYRKLLCPIYGARVPRPIVEKALVYYAGPANPYYLGPAPLEKMAEQIAGARGGSGSNREYLLKLANSLHSLDVHDAHVKTLANAVTHRVFL
jgi:cation transport protein ChaC